jgi:hypothetical protein
MRMGISVPVLVTVDTRWLSSHEDTFGFSAKCFLTLQTADASEEIDYGHITHIIRQPEGVYEIVANRRSFALKSAKPLFDSMMTEPFLSRLKFNARDWDRTIELRKAMTERWVKREISSFSYVLILNSLSGRSFHNHSLYPVFPSIGTDFSSSWDGPIDHRVVVAPEYYFLPGEHGSPNVIYRNRIQLESREDLHVWINRVFGADDRTHPTPFLPHSHPARRPRSPPLVGRISVKLPEVGEILFAHFISRGSFACVVSSGHLLFFSVAFDERLQCPALKTKISKSYSIHPTPDTRFFATKSTVAVSDSSSFTVFTADQRSAYPPCQIRGWSGGIAQISDTELATLSRAGQWKTLISLTERIVCFGTGCSFNLIAAACDDGYVRLRSASDGTKIATVFLEGDFPDSVAVTPVWGFVVVRCIHAFFVCTNAGIPCQMVPSEQMIRWFVFKGFEGTDFLAEVGEDGNGRCLEVGDPTSAISVRIGGSVAALGFAERQDCFLAIVPGEGMLAIPRHMHNIPTTNGAA